MQSQTQTQTQTPPMQITLTRQIAASPERVWQVLTETASILLWFGMEGVTNLDAEFEARPGGAWHVNAQGPDGARFAMRGINREVEPGRRLVQSWQHVDAAGLAGNETEAEILLEPIEGGTRLTVHHRRIALTPELFEAGWTQSLAWIERLAA